MDGGRAQIYWNVSDLDVNKVALEFAMRNGVGMDDLPVLLGSIKNFMLTKMGSCGGGGGGEKSGRGGGGGEELASAICARYAKENKREALAESARILSTLLGNLAREDTPKFRRVNLQNVKVKEAVAARHAMAVLEAAGFEPVEGGAAMESKGADASARAAQVAAVLDAACALRRAHDSNVGWSDDELLEGAQALVGEGNERLQRGDARGALQKYEECRAFGQAMRDRKRAMAVEGAAVGNLGDAYRRLGQYKKAIEHHTMALAISREIGDREGEGNHLGNLGNAYDSLGQYKKAIEHHTMALAICRKIGDREGEGNHLGNLGSAYDSLGQYKKAIEHHTMALAISRKIGDRQGEGNHLGNLGTAYDSLGQYKKAIEHHTMALAISREIGDKQGEGSDLGNLGIAYFRLGQYEKAIEHHRMALAISREIGDRQGEGGTLGGLGNAYDSLGQYEKAIEHYTMALKISREIGDRQGEGNALGGLGIAYFRLGQYEKAIEHHTMALAISREIGDKQVEGNALGNLGGAYLSLGQYEKAIEHYTMALKISREIGDRQGEGNGLGGLGIAYFRLGQYEKAIEHHTMALDICRKIGHRQGEGGTLGGLGNAYHSLGQYKKAIEHHTMALDINREIGDRRVEGSALTNLGTAYLSLGQYEKALERLAAATAVFDALWAGLRTDHDRITFGDTIGFTLTPRLLQRVHARLAQPEAALEVAERARSRAFELLLAQQRVQRGADAAAAPPPTLPAAVDVAALRGLAGRQRVALVIFSQVQDTALLAWVVRGDAPVAFHELAVPAQGGASPLTQLVEQTRQTIGVRARHGSSARSAAVSSTPGALREPSVDQKAIEAERGDGRTAAPDESYIRAALARCYKLLIAPLGLSAGEPLLIIPDRDLFALPFAALLDSDGKHLIERHSLRIAPSAGTLIELEQRAADRGAPPPRPPALVVGDPDFSGWTTKGGGHLSQLPGARAETSVVQGLLNTFKAKLRLDDEATKEAMMQLLPTSDVIHLATHGAPDGLYFAGESEVEATLSMAEVQGLDLRARLVVLSACDSFKAPKGEGGSELSTDGVVGITRAFVAAGALTLVSSLWKVSDDATRELMRRFYTAWVAGGDVAAALREAMVGMIEEGRWSVREWGAFVVYGMAGDGDGVAAATSGVSILTLEGGGGGSGGSGGVDGGASGGIVEAAAASASTSASASASASASVTVDLPWSLSSSSTEEWLDVGRFDLDRGKKAASAKWHGKPQKPLPAGGPIPPAHTPFTPLLWHQLIQKWPSGVPAERVVFAQYFHCAAGPSREFWIQFYDDDQKALFVFHIHYAGTRDKPDFSRVTHVNARLSYPKGAHVKLCEYTQRSIDLRETNHLNLIGGHNLTWPKGCLGHQWTLFALVEVRTKIDGSEKELKEVLQQCMRVFGYKPRHVVKHSFRPLENGFTSLTIELLLGVDHPLLQQQEQHVPGSFKVERLLQSYAPLIKGWSYEDAAQPYPAWPAYGSAQAAHADPAQLPASTPDRAVYQRSDWQEDLRKLLMRLEEVRLQRVKEVHGNKTTPHSMLTANDEHGSSYRGGTRSGESEGRTPEKVQLKCSLTGPPTVPFGEESFELKVWLLAATAELTDLLKQELAFEESKQLAVDFAAVAATEVAFRVDVTVEGCEVEPAYRLVKWTDQTLCHSAFDVAVPADFSESALQCRVLVRSQANPNVSLDLNKSLKRSAPGAASPASVIATSASLEMKIDGVRAIVEQMAIGEHSCPRIPWLQPEKAAGGGLARRVGRKLRPSRWITDAYRLFFVCPVTLKLAPTNGGQGYLVRLPKSWWKTHGWWVRGTLVALAAASTTAGRVIGLPLELGDTVVSALEQVQAFEAAAIRDYIDAIVDAAPSATGSSGAALAEARPATAADFRALKALVEKTDPQLLHCGLTLAVADDGTVEWVAPDVLARFKAQGRAALQYETAGAAASSSTTA